MESLRYAVNMKILPVTNDKLHVTFRLYPTTAALRRAVRRALPGEPVTPLAIGYHLGRGRVSNIFLAEKNKAWYECGLHECIHSAEYLAKYRPRGVNESEFMAYFADGLYSCLVRWAMADFPRDTSNLNFEPSLARLRQAIDPDNSTETT